MRTSREHLFVMQPLATLFPIAPAHPHPSLQLPQPRQTPSTSLALLSPPCLPVPAQPTSVTLASAGGGISDHTRQMFAEHLSP